MHNCSQTTGKPVRNPKRRSFTLIHIFALIFAMVIIIVVIWVGESMMVYPKMSTDYIAKFNEISKPHGFDPISNAWPDLEIAFENLEEIPDELDLFITRWPEDMNQAELKMAADWINQNEESIKYLNRAAQKQYLWHPYESRKNNMLKISIPYLRRYRAAGRLLSLNAKMLASEGKLPAAFEMLQNACKYGAFFSGNKYWSEQFAGLDIRAMVASAAVDVIYYTDPCQESLADFQKAISRISSEYPFYFSFVASRLAFFEGVLRTDDEDNGFWPVLQNIVSAYGDDSEGISPESTLIVVQEIYAYADSLISKSPFEYRDLNAEEELIRISNKNRIVRMYSPDFLRTIGFACRCSAQNQALIVILALQRYKIKTGDYPDSLDVLEKQGFIEKIPIDPFSGNPFVYRKRQDNFILYSYAGDMDDDYGQHDPKWAEFGDGDFVFWPPQENLQR